MTAGSKWKSSLNRRKGFVMKRWRRRYFFYKFVPLLKRWFTLSVNGGEGRSLFACRWWGCDQLTYDKNDKNTALWTVHHASVIVEHCGISSIQLQNQRCRHLDVSSLVCPVTSVSRHKISAIITAGGLWHQLWLLLLVLLVLILFLEGAIQNPRRSAVLVSKLFLLFSCLFGSPKSKPVHCSTRLI